MTDQPVAFLLTWNPSLMPMNEAAEAEVLRRGGVLPGRWSVGQRMGGIRPGNDLWLFRTGKIGTNPGIVRRGRAVGEVFPAAHWSSQRASSGATTNYVLLEWFEHAPVGSPLSREVLLREVPGPPWANLQASGVGLDADTARRLLEVWEHHLQTSNHSSGNQIESSVDGDPHAIRVDEQFDARPASQQFVLRYLSEHGVAFSSDLVTAAQGAKVTSDVMLALYKLHRDGYIVRDAGPPVRWSLAHARTTSPHLESGPSVSSAVGTSPHHVVELFLGWAQIEWSHPQIRAAVEGPNVQRMTAFAPDELRESLRGLKSEPGVEAWEEWFQSASRLRSRSIRL